MSIPSLTAPIQKMGSLISNLPAPPGGFRLGLLAGPLAFIVNEAINARPTSPAALDEIDPSLYKPTDSVDTQVPQAPGWFGGQQSGVLYKLVYNQAVISNGTLSGWNYTLSANNAGLIGPLSNVRLYANGQLLGKLKHWSFRQLGETPIFGDNTRPYRVEVINANGENIVALNTGTSGVEVLGFVPQSTGVPDQTMPPLVGGSSEVGSQNPVPSISPEPPLTNEEFFKRFGAPPRLNKDLFAPPVPGAKSPPNVTPIPTGDTFPDINIWSPAVNLPASDPAKDTVKVGAAPASSNNTYTRTYTKTGSDAWRSTPGTKTYSPGVDNLGLKSPANVRPGSQVNVGNNGGVTPQNPATPVNPPVVNVPPATDTLITGITSTLALILDQTSKTKIKEATSEGVCETTAPGKCLNNLVNNPNWLGGLGVGLDSAQLLLSKEILAFVKNTNQVINHPKYGLSKIQSFAETAWKSTRIQKLLDVLSLALSLHNAAMLSRNLAGSLGDITSSIINNTINLIKNEDNSNININEIVGNTIENFLKGLLGEATYTGVSETFNRYSRIINAAANIIYSVQSVMAGMAEGLEIMGRYTGKIGNALKKSGAVLENSYSWMSETLSVKTGHLGRIQQVLDGAEAVENVASEIQNATEEFREVQENVNNIGDQFDKVKDEVATKETEKATTETTGKTNSQGAQPSQTDLVKDVEEE